MSRNPTRRVARWVAGAKDITATPEDAANYLTIARLSELIGLAPGTIMDSITRRPITKKTNPRSAICQPVAHIAEKLPFWSHKQLNDFLDIRRNNQEAKEEAKRSGTKLRLEPVTEAEAARRGLFSLVQFAEQLNIHDQTLRRAHSQDGSFPHAVAQLDKDTAGVPEHLFPAKKVMTWARAQGYLDTAAAG